MVYSRKQSSFISDLRQIAEKQLRGQVQDYSQLTSEEIQKTFHELEVHQIELELQNEELKRVQNDLKRSRDSYAELYDFAPVAYVELNKDSQIKRANITCCKMFGLNRTELLKTRFQHFIVPEEAERFYFFLKTISDTKNPVSCELRLQTSDSKPFDADLQIESMGQSDSSQHAFRIAIINATERKQAEHQALLAGILQILNRHDGLSTLVSGTLRLIKTTIGFDAVGLRLRQGDDCPYFEVNGFSDEFIKEENFLCPKSRTDNTAHDINDKAGLEGTCGLMLSGKQKPNLPCFSSGGSFWTNNSNELLNLPPEIDPKFNPRNRCILQGYQSVGLFPVIAGSNIIGLLQLNDRRPGQFTSTMVSLFENIGRNIGLALQRITAEKALLDLNIDLENRVLERTRDLQKALGEEKEYGANLRLLSTVVSNSSDAIITFGLDGYITSWNRSAERMYGFTATEALEMHMERLVPDQEIPKTRTLIEAIKNGKAVQPLEVRRRKKDGSLIDIWLTATRMLDDTASIVGITATEHDITERNQKEEALRRSEKQYRLLFSANPNPMFVFDEDTLQFLAVNEAAVKKYGWPRDEFLAMSILDIRPQEGRVKTRESIKANRGVFSSNIGPALHRCKDGTVITVEITASSILFDGRPGRLTSVNDVTDRNKAFDSMQQSEARLKATFAAVPSVLVEFDLNGNVIFANAAAVSAIGFDPKDKNRDLVVSSLVFRNLDGNPVPKENLPTSRSLKGATIGGELYKVKTADGAERIILTYMAPIILSCQVAGSVGLWYDVSELKRAEEALRALAGRVLSAQEEERQSLARELHDEVGQNLTVIKMMLGTAERTAPEELKPRMKEIANLTLGIIRSVRLIAQSLRPPALDILGLEASLRELLGRLKEQAGLSVDFDCQIEGQIPFPIALTAYRIVQESLTNVMRHSGVSAAMVQIRLESNTLKIRIEDKGRGYDIKTPRTSTGLSAMRERAILVGGTVNMESAPGVGTVVAAELPCC